MLRKLYNHLFCQPHMGRRIPVLLVSVILMGMCVAFFEKTQVGTDPCTVFNLSIAQNVLHWNNLGTWQLLFNLILLVGILLLKEGRCIGLGSLANMVLVGYSRDFFKPIVEMLLPGEVESLLVRGAVFVPAMAVFLVAVAFYMVVELGTAPYDAVPQIIARRAKLPFAWVRIGYDILVTVTGLLLGGQVGVFTVLACFFLGPVIAAIAAKFRPWFN
ncbi:MAG: YitT family protein [Aristaeellaceae bacterium]